MSRGCKYGRVDEVTVFDSGGQLVDVTVDFMVERMVLAEFMDSLQAFDPRGNREPIQALLDHSAELGHPKEDE